MSTLYLLFESSSGYALFERVASEEISLSSAAQSDVLDLKRFSEMVKLKAFRAFTSAENALENINAISEGEATEFLLNWLELSLPKPTKKSTYQLGVLDPKVGGMIKDTLSIPCISTPLTDELLRGVRLHFLHYIKELKAADLQQAQLGLSHAYSRSKVKFNVHRVDNMIIQSSALLDQLDKDLNTFCMRVREWYSWHFPELIRIVPDNLQYAQCCRLIQNKAQLNRQTHLPALIEILQDEAKANSILEAAKMSMGTDISPIDMINIEQFATRVIALGMYRNQLHAYLIAKMNTCAPNLSALIGELVGARLISHAGSLTNLAKYPASTVQILGAEKALFRALKTKGNTPKYGLIFHSTFIGRAAVKNKGRISRYLANKCSIASRIDSFSDHVTAIYGVKLREQVEERLEFYKSGVAPKKNIEVMEAAVKLDHEEQEREGGGEAKTMEVEGEDGRSEGEKKKKKKKKDKKDKERGESTSMEVEHEKAAAAPTPASPAAPPPRNAKTAASTPSAPPAAASDTAKKDKKDKKRKAEEPVSAPAPAAAPAAAASSKKKDKKQKH